MPKFIHSPQALQDLDEIWHYIAWDNISAADRLIDAIAEKCRLLSENPEMGENLTHLSVGLRCFSAGNYAIYFRPVVGGIEVVRVLHGARDSGKLLSDH
jgi:toxin ParE1/3/4